METDKIIDKTLINGFYFKDCNYKFTECSLYIDNSLLNNNTISLSTCMYEDHTLRVCVSREREIDIYI